MIVQKREISLTIFFYCWITHNNLLCWEIHRIKRDVQYQVKIQAHNIFSVKPELA